MTHLTLSLKSWQNYSKGPDGELNTVRPRSPSPFLSIQNQVECLLLVRSGGGGERLPFHDDTQTAGEVNSVTGLKRIPTHLPTAAAAAEVKALAMRRQSGTIVTLPTAAPEEDICLPRSC